MFRIVEHIIAWVLWSMWVQFPSLVMTFARFALRVFNWGGPQKMLAVILAALLFILLNGEGF